MIKTNVFWERDLPKLSGYYLTTWGPDRTVSKMYYATDFGWTFGRAVGAGSNIAYGKKITDVYAWTFLPDACPR